MRKIYQILNGFLGEEAEIHEGAPAPAGWTFTEPPVIKGGQAARWNGEGWDVVEAKLMVEANEAAAAIAFEDHKKAVITTVNRLCDSFLAALKAGYPEGEVQSWPQQVAEAEKLAANSGASTPLLSALAERRGVPLAALATKVLEKANAFAAASGAIIGHRQRLEDALHAAKTLAEVDAVDVNAGWLVFG